MESKRRTSTPKSSTKSQSHSKSKPKKSSSPALKDSKFKMNVDPAHSVLSHKKKTGQHLVKKKIE